MQRYVKGARSERELLNRFYDKGFSVLRSAGSGVNALGPDIIAIRNKVCIAIECKAWERGSLSLDEDQFVKLIEWEKTTAFPTFVAWRVNNKGWFFIKLNEFTRGKVNFNVTLKKAMQVNRLFDEILLLAPPGHSSEPSIPESNAVQLPTTDSGLEPSLA